MPTTTDPAVQPPQLVYELVYRRPDALFGAEPLLRFTCKSGEKKRADERTRTADLVSLRVCLQAC